MLVTQFLFFQLSKNVDHKNHRMVAYNLVDKRFYPEILFDYNLTCNKVEVNGVEPMTPCLQSRCSSQLSYTPR